jgi:hypothetical protein
MVVHDELLSRIGRLCRRGANDEFIEDRENDFGKFTALSASLTRRCIVAFGGSRPATRCAVYHSGFATAHHAIAENDIADSTRASDRLASSAISAPS